jgi:hypothetical protein
MSDTELALAGIAASLIDDIVVARSLELAAGLPGRERVMGPHEHEVARQANPDYARLKGIPPLDPGAEKWCSYCGNSNPGQLVPGPDHEFGFSDWMCRDGLDRHCQARHERRWPAMPEKAEPILMKLARMQDDAQADAVRARQQAAQQPQEPAEQPEQYTLPGWSAATVNGAYDVHGQWRPPMPAYQAYARTLANDRSHLLDGGPRPHYYPGPNHVPLAVTDSMTDEERAMRTAAALRGHVPPGVVSGAASASELPGSGPAQTVPYGVPEGVRPPGGTVPPAGGQAVQHPPQVPYGAHRGQEGGDIALQQPQWQASPVAGPQPRRRRLRYSSGKRPARKHPGIGGSDSFGNSPDTGGPSGSASSAEVT